MEGEHFVFWGTGTAVGMREMISQQNVIPNLEIEFRTFNLVQSDHQPFFLQKIPVLLPSTGLYPELHRPEDDVEFAERRRHAPCVATRLRHCLRPGESE